MSEKKLKPVLHGARKDWIKKMFELSNDEDKDAALAKTIAFREEFLKRHLVEDVNLDELPASEVDELLKKLEGDMDFTMGLQRLMRSNTTPSRGSATIETPAK